MTGAQAEQWAAQHLQQQGLKPVAQNYRGRFGEIDPGIAAVGLRKGAQRRDREQGRIRTSTVDLRPGVRPQV